jgi:PAS domain S-box-containing protein
MPHRNIPIHVLIIDDDEDDFFITSEYLKNIEGRKFVIEWCYRYNDAIEKIKENVHDVYLVDYRLGAKTGIDIIKEAAAMQVSKPFILLTGKGDIKIDVEAMSYGALDYLVKGQINSETLERSIRYSIDRARTMNEIKAQEKKYRDIFDKSGDAIFVADGNFCFTQINHAFEKLLDCDELFIKHNMQLFDVIVDPLHKNKIAQLLSASNTVEDFETEVCYKNGNIKQCILSASKETDINNIIYYQGIFHDITFLKAAEKATLRAEKLAATGRLVRTLAHEVRNPINNINLAAEQLRSLIQPTDESTIYLDIVYRNSNRINGLIKELLNSARPEEMRMAPVSINTLLDEIINTARDRAHLKNILIHVHDTDDAIILKCDEQKIQIAILNIIINAIEAIDNNTGEIHITVIKKSAVAVIKITDNGSGITPEHLPRLFEPYFTSKRNGIGLGLAATFNILQAHQGTVEVASEVNKGTTFTITLPLL